MSSSRIGDQTDHDVAVNIRPRIETVSSAFLVVDPATSKKWTVQSVRELRILARRLLLQYGSEKILLIRPLENDSLTPCQLNPDPDLNHCSNIDTEKRGISKPEDTHEH